MLWLANGGNTYAALTTRYFLVINTLYKSAFLLLKDSFPHSSSRDAPDHGVGMPGNIPGFFLFFYLSKDSRTQGLKDLTKDARTQGRVRLPPIQLLLNERSLLTQ